MKTSLNLSIYPLLLSVLAGCASQQPPVIALDEPVEAQRLPEPPRPIEVVEIPKPLALPAQLKPLPETHPSRPAKEPADERVRVSRANRDARVAPSREGYINAIQVWPYSDGALYQVYASPGRVTAINLQPGEELITVAAGDTVRWIVGDTTSGTGDELRTSVLIKPTRVDLKTNLVITTTRRTYLIELSSTEQAWMASVSWDYPKDRMLALRRHASAAQAAAPAGGRRPGAGAAAFSLCDQRKQSTLEAAARLRRRPQGVYPVSRWHRPGRVASAVRDWLGRRRTTGQLPLPLALLHRRPSVRCGRVAPGRRQR